MRIYVAGPMTGLPDNNRKAFAFAWNRLMDAGFDAVSPHFLESAIEVETRAKIGIAAVYRHVLPVDLFALSGVDGVLALPGWEESRGAKFEKHFADLIEIPWVVSSDPLNTQLEVWVTDCINQLEEATCPAP
jgi:hypothetical protein